MYQVCIIGGGAAGMATAVEIATNNKDIEILLIEKKDKPGSKILASGNGRCNISNNQCPRFGETAKFFRNIGVEIKVTEEGRAYPVSEKASDVVFALVNMLKIYNIKIMDNQKAEDIKYIGEHNFEIHTDKGTVIKAENVVLATGGKSAPQFGTTGDGYVMAKKLGHKISKLIPVLVPVECTNDTIGNISGTRAKCSVTLFRNDFFVETQQGELQFTKDGLSGICIFNLSSFIRLNENTKFEDYRFEVDFLDRYSFMEVFHILSLRRNIKDFKTIDIFNSIVNRNIAEKLLKEFAKKYEFARDLDDKTLEDIIYSFKKVKFNVTGVKGWKDAQCTAGGVDWDEFDDDTMESKKCKGLYFAGEIIDYNGPCGGFNLENAWSNGRKAGRTICTEYMK